jgi:putative Ca2+/H+ antiporter (TMEM165/GDT1 family)
VTALLLGRVIKKCCKERMIHLLGGIAFIAFGVWELFFGILYKDII